MNTERLRELLSYDVETGVFRWRVSLNCNAVVGTVAGTRTDRGYIRIKIDHRDHRAHRLAWQHVNGTPPSSSIDHINGDPSDNRIENLREATHAQNMSNHKMRANNTSGFRGVSWNRQDGKWRVSARHEGVQRYLGRFSTPEEAARAYDAFVIATRGEFARTNLPTTEIGKSTQA